MRIHLWFLNHKAEFLKYAVSRAISRWEEAGGVRQDLKVIVEFEKTYD